MRIVDGDFRGKSSRPRGSRHTRALRGGSILRVDCTARGGANGPNRKRERAQTFIRPIEFRSPFRLSANRRAFTARFDTRCPSARSPRFPPGPLISNVTLHRGELFQLRRLSCFSIDSLPLNLTLQMTAEKSKWRNMTVSFYFEEFRETCQVGCKLGLRFVSVWNLQVYLLSSLTIPVFLSSEIPSSTRCHGRKKNLVI